MLNEPTIKQPTVFHFIPCIQVVSSISQTGSLFHTTATQCRSDSDCGCVFFNFVKQQNSRTGFLFVEVKCDLNLYLSCSQSNPYVNFQQEPINLSNQI